MTDTDDPRARRLTEAGFTCDQRLDVLVQRGRGTRHQRWDRPPEHRRMDRWLGRMAPPKRRSRDRGPSPEHANPTRPGPAIG